jgi:hypothetical protein
MAKTSHPTRAPNKALYLTDYARSGWDIGALRTSAARLLAGRLLHRVGVSTVACGLRVGRILMNGH